MRILYLQNLPVNNNIGFSSSEFLVVKILPVVSTFGCLPYIKGIKKQVISSYLT